MLVRPSPYSTPFTPKKCLKQGKTASSNQLLEIKGDPSKWPPLFMNPNQRLQCIRSRSQEARPLISLMDSPIEFGGTPFGKMGDSPRFMQNYSLASFRSPRDDVKPTTLKEKLVKNLTLESFLDENGGRPIFTDLDKYDLPEPSDM